tara:strand:+ start:2764 stop:2889 length:126 start_codon:yes stop_codon:yes gene_type:complete
METTVRSWALKNAVAAEGAGAGGEGGEGDGAKWGVFAPTIK